MCVSCLYHVSLIIRADEILQLKFLSILKKKKTKCEYLELGRVTIRQVIKILIKYKSDIMQKINKNIFKKFKHFQIPETQFILYFLGIFLIFCNSTICIK